MAIYILVLWLIYILWRIYVQPNLVMLVFVRPNSSYVRPKLKVIGQMSCQVKYLFAALYCVWLNVPNYMAGPRKYPEIVNNSCPSHGYFDSETIIKTEYVPRGRVYCGRALMSLKYWIAKNAYPQIVLIQSFTGVSVYHCYPMY